MRLAQEQGRRAQGQQGRSDAGHPYVAQRHHVGGRDRRAHRRADAVGGRHAVVAVGGGRRRLRLRRSRRIAKVLSRSHAAKIRSLKRREEFVRLTLREFAVLSVGFLTLLAPQGALADPFPPGAQAQNVKQIGFSELGWRYGAVKVGITHTADDKWYLYTGHSFNQGWSIVDVTDPTNPRYVKFIPYVTDDKSIITAQVTLHDDLMITSLNSFKPQANPLPAILLWDISDPETPKQVGSWQGGVTGAHRNSYPGGKYAYLSTSYPGFKQHIMVILDVSDPAHPKEVGKYWQPGQKDGEPPSPYPRSEE